MTEFTRALSDLGEHERATLTGLLIRLRDREEFRDDAWGRALASGYNSLLIAMSDDASRRQDEARAFSRIIRREYGSVVTPFDR